MPAEILVNKMTPATASKFNKFKKQLDEESAKHGRPVKTADSREFPFLGNGVTASVSRLTDKEVVRVQITGGSTNDRYIGYLKMCLTQRSKHFPKISYVEIQKDAQGRVERIISVMELLEGLREKHDASRARHDIESYMYETHNAIRALENGNKPARVTLPLPSQKDPLIGSFSRDSLRRVFNKAVEAGLHFNDCHSGNMMIRREGKKKTLVITDPVV